MNLIDWNYQAGNMKESAKYLKTVEWSEEGQCYIGRCPSLFHGGYHGINEIEVYSELCKIVEVNISKFKQDKQELPNPNCELKIWWVPQISGDRFEVSVKSVTEGVKLLETLATYDMLQYENNISSDYFHIGGLLRLDDDGDWVDWYDYESGLSDPFEYLALMSKFKFIRVDKAENY